MHTFEMLAEKVFSVEDGFPVGAQIIVAVPVGYLEMLAVYVTLPLVFAAKCLLAAREVEYTEEWSEMLLVHVFFKVGGVIKHFPGVVPAHFSLLGLFTGAPAPGLLPTPGFPGFLALPGACGKRFHHTWGAFTPAALVCLQLQRPGRRILSGALR